MDDWKHPAKCDLLGRRQRAAWSYRVGSKPCVEPTALAVLALLAGTERSGSSEIAAAVGPAGEWLASLQQANGSLGISESLSEPGWATPYALLAWNALGGFETERRRAVNWLLQQAGGVFPKDIGPRPVHGHDTSIVGWPWTSGAHSWVEPTAMAVLALRREGLGNHARVQEGLRLLRDRAIVTGGWNCGNKSTYGHILRPQPATTGIALLALAHADTRAELPRDAIRYLLQTLPGVGAPPSLGWGVLGLRAWDQSPRDADHWLSDSFAKLAGRPDSRQGWQFCCWPRARAQWNFSMRIDDETHSSGDRGHRPRAVKRRQLLIRRRRNRGRRPWCQIRL